jgi:hypothetical protein
VIIWQLCYQILIIILTLLVWDKNKVGKSLESNISIPGYHFISQPTNTEAGGVGFYIRNDCEFHDHSDLTISTNEFEILVYSNQGRREATTGSRTNWWTQDPLSLLTLALMATPQSLFFNRNQWGNRQRITCKKSPQNVGADGVCDVHACYRTSRWT